MFAVVDLEENEQRVYASPPIPIWLWSCCSNDIFMPGLGFNCSRMIWMEDE